MRYRTIVTAAFGVLLVGCSRWNTEVAPAGFAVVREHVISVTGNEPPISSTLDFTIMEVDGRPVVRENVPSFVDMQRGALVSAGNHAFKVRVSPHLRPPNQKPEEVVFSARVQSTKVYYLVDKDAAPALIEAKPGQK